MAVVVVSYIKIFVDIFKLLLKGETSDITEKGENGSKQIVINYLEKHSKSKTLTIIPGQLECLSIDTNEYVIAFKYFGYDSLVLLRRNQGLYLEVISKIPGLPNPDYEKLFTMMKNTSYVKWDETKKPEEPENEVEKEVKSSVKGKVSNDKPNEKGNKKK